MEVSKLFDKYDLVQIKSLEVLENEGQFNTVESREGYLSSVDALSGVKICNADEDDDGSVAFVNHDGQYKASWFSLVTEINIPTQTINFPLLQDNCGYFLPEKIKQELSIEQPVINGGKYKEYYLSETILQTKCTRFRFIENCDVEVGDYIYLHGSYSDTNRLKCEQILYIIDQVEKSRGHCWYRCCTPESNPRFIPNSLDVDYRNPMRHFMRKEL